jgi:hypothetical protein
MCTPPRSLSQSSNPLELHVVRSTWACQSMIMSCICTRGIGDDYIILGRHLFAPPIPIPAVPKRKGSLRFCCDFACAREASPHHMTPSGPLACDGGQQRVGFRRGRSCRAKTTWESYEDRGENVQGERAGSDKGTGRRSHNPKPKRKPGCVVEMGGRSRTLGTFHLQGMRGPVPSKANRAATQTCCPTHRFTSSRLVA